MWQLGRLWRGVKLEMTVDRILRLDAMAAYPNSPFVDMIVFLGCFEGRTVRVWLMTDADCPSVSIDEVTLEHRGEVAGECRWLDLGVTSELGGRFGQLRIEGMSVAEARRSFLLFTQDLDFRPAGDLGDAEQQVLGMRRRDAGSTTLTPCRVTVGAPTDFQATYTAGSGGLPPGARVRFAIPHAFSHPQTEDESAPGFVEASGEAAVQIESVGVSDDSHEQADLICLLPEGLAPAGRVVVRYRTEEMYLFNWRRYLVERPYWFAHLVPFAAAVAVDERRRWVELLPENSHCFETVAGPAERLHLFLPGRVKEDVAVTLRGVFTDRYRNVPTGRGVPRRVKLTLQDEMGERGLGSPRGMFQGAHRFAVLLGRLEPGLYRVRAYDAVTEEPVAQSNPLQVIEADSDELSIYWGEIHGHTEQSDGLGGFEEMFRYARDEGCLDFSAAADHACYFTDNEWEWMQDTINACNERGRFVTLIGYEWAGQHGHRCIYARGRRLELLRGMCEATSSLDTFYEHFRGNGDVVAGPHHTGAGGWMAHHDPEIERFIEIYSMWGASDRIGAPKAPVTAGPSALPADRWLNAGAMLGFTGGGDCHEGRSGWSCEDPDGQGSSLHTFARALQYRSGLTAALMEELRRRELLTALRERRTYATTGARILLEFQVSGVAMGGEGPAKRARVRATVHGVTELARLEVICGGEVVHSEDVDGLDARLKWTDPNPVAERQWYYLHVIQRDGHEAWSSPVWVYAKGS